MGVSPNQGFQGLYRGFIRDMYGLYRGCIGFRVQGFPKLGVLV